MNGPRPSVEVAGNRPSILIVNPHPRFSREKAENRVISPSIGLHSLASMARKNGFAAQVLDLSYSTAATLESKLRNEKFDFVGVSFYHATLQESSEVAVLAKRASPDSVIVGGGQEATFNYKEIMGNGVPVDIIVKGFGEFTLSEVMRVYPGSRDLRVFNSIPGLIINGQNADLIDTGPARALDHASFLEITDTLDYASIPYRDSWLRFRERFSNKHGKAVKAVPNLIKIFIGNYCPMGCDFCASTNFLKDAHDMKNPSVISLRAVEMFLHIRRIAGVYPEVDAFYFNDDNITIDRRKLLEFGEVLENNGLSGRFRFFGQVRTDMVDKELLSAMGKMGFHTINYGVESFSDRMLERLDKKNHSSSNELAIDWARKAGINPLVNLILFPPEIKKEDLCQTVDKCLELIRSGIYLFAIAPFVDLLPGSRMADKGYETEAVEINIPEANIKFSTSGRIWPKDQQMKELALASYELLDSCAEHLKLINGDFEHAPEILSVLALFYAIYRNLKMPDKLAEVESTAKGVRI